MSASEARSEPLLSFRMGGIELALRAGWVAGVVEPTSIRRVHGAPRAVLGLAECSGRILTVLDLAGLLGMSDVGAAACLVCLTTPLDHLALLVPAGVRFSRSPGPISEEPDGGPGDALLGTRLSLGDGEVVQLLRPESLLRAVRARESR